MSKTHGTAVYRSAFQVNAIIALLLWLFIQFALPLLPGLLYAAYHASEMEWLYSVYGALKFALGYLAVMEPRWLVSLIIAVAISLPCLLASLLTARRIAKAATQ